MSVEADNPHLKPERGNKTCCDSYVNQSRGPVNPVVLQYPGKLATLVYLLTQKSLASEEAIPSGTIRFIASLTHHLARYRRLP
jgi:hypothetical protein